MMSLAGAAAGEGAVSHHGTYNKLHKSHDLFSLSLGSGGDAPSGQGGNLPLKEDNFDGVQDLSHTPCLV